MGRTTTLLLRLTLGAVFLLSGGTKLIEPLLFATALRGFKLGLDDGVIAWLAYGLPWIECLVGAALAIGLAVRAGCLLVILLMVAFDGGIVSLILRGLDVACPCFGSIDLFCTGPLGWCHLIRNGILALAAAALWWLTAAGPAARTPRPAVVDGAADPG